MFLLAEIADRGALAWIQCFSVDPTEYISTGARGGATIITGKQYAGRLYEGRQLDRSDLLNKLRHLHRGRCQWLVGQILTDSAVIVLRGDVGMVAFRSMLARTSLALVTMSRRGIVLADRTQDGRMAVLMNVAVMMKHGHRHCQQIANKRDR